MSFRDDNDDGRELRKPFLHTGSWYKMGSRQSSIMSSSAQILRDGSISVVFCVLIVALGPIQFGFTVTTCLRTRLFSHPIHVFIKGAFIIWCSVAILHLHKLESSMILIFQFQRFESVAFDIGFEISIHYTLYKFRVCDCQTVLHFRLFSKCGSYGWCNS